MQHNDHYVRNQLIFEQNCIDGRTLTSVGKEHGISRERVRQIAAKQQRMIHPNPPKWAMQDLMPMYRDLLELAGDMV